MRGEFLWIYILFGSIALFLVIVACRSIIKIKKDKKNLEFQKDDNKYFGAFFFFMFFMFFVVTVVFIISLFDTTPHFEDFLTLIFILFFNSFGFLFAFDLIHPIKQNRKNILSQIILIPLVLSLGIYLLLKFIPEKEWIKVSIVVIISICILFRKKLEKLYKKII